jgi:antitoxin ParD1/3/4
MEVTISEPQESFVKQAVREGRYASESDVVNLGIRMVQERDQKLADLRAMIAESLEDGPEDSAAERDRALEEQERELIVRGCPK